MSGGEGITLDFAYRIIGIFGGTVAGIIAFIKLIKYIASSRKRLDNKLDSMKESLENQHNNDMNTIKGFMGEIKGDVVGIKASVEISNNKIQDLTDRVARSETKLDATCVNISEMKDNISNIRGNQKANIHRLDDVENELKDNKKRRVYMEDKRNKSSVSKKRSRRKS